MNWKPKQRTDGRDEFMVQRAVQEVMKEMEQNGWTQAEAEMFPKCLEGTIRKNSERIEKLKPFTVCDFTQQSLTEKHSSRQNTKQSAETVIGITIDLPPIDCSTHGTQQAAKANK